MVLLIIVYKITGICNIFFAFCLKVLVVRLVNLHIPQVSMVWTIKDSKCVWCGQ